MTAFETAQLAAQVLDTKKGEQVRILGIRDVSVLGDYFVIATGTSGTHVKALADEVARKVWLRFGVKLEPEPVIV